MGCAGLARLDLPGVLDLEEAQVAQEPQGEQHDGEQEEHRRVALEPGETKTVPLSVEAKELAWFNPEANAWEIEPMTYGVMVGPSSAPAALLKATFTVE